MGIFQDISMTLKSGIIIACALSLTGCAPVSILNNITPSSSFEKTSDISFGPGTRDKMDIYRSETSTSERPVLVFVHGGSWNSGSKDIYKFLADGFTQIGYDVVVPNYRLYPDAVFPEFLNDNARAVKSVEENFPNRPIVLMGHSAGAYNVLMLGLKDDYLKSVGVDRCTSISGVVGLAAPTGLVPLDSEPWTTIFPDRFTGQDAVLNNVSAPSPAIFLGHGSEDETVFPQNSEALAEKVSARGGKADVKLYAKQSHSDVVKVLSRHFDGDVSLKDDIIGFIETLPTAGNFCQ